MSSSFRPTTESKVAANKFVPRRGISFALQVAILAGLVTWAIVQLSSRAIEQEQRRDYVAKQQASLQGPLSSLANDISRPLDTGQNLRVQKTISTRFADKNVMLLNANSEVWQFGATRNSALPPLPIDEFEIRASVEGARIQLGTLVLRSKVPTLHWTFIVAELSLTLGSVVAVLAFLYVRFAMRGLNGIHGLLEQMRKGNYCERTAQVGCSQVRQTIEHFHAALGEMTTLTEHARKIYLETAIALSKTIEAKDRYTSGHSQRVAVYATEMGKRLGFESERMETLRIGALLHDIGKVAVPDDVLLKAGALTDEEFATMKRHPLAGDRILAALPGMRDMADIARSHHERWDGRGYPMGVAGDSIPLEGRIVAIADAYDALVTKRSYKSALPVEKALNIIEKDAGSHFDPYLAKMFVAMKRNGQGYKACKAKSFDQSPLSNETMGRS
jgi:putative nucleotidyltransferase with HDIG domain